MNDEIRVTVVATGLNHVEKPELVKPNLQGVQATKAEQAVAVEPKMSIAPEPAPTIQASVQAKTVEMKQPELGLNETEVVRKATVNGVDTVSSMSNSSYLDIPAFLRRQAD